jgi:hypothetical protein
MVYHSHFQKLFGRKNILDIHLDSEECCSCGLNPAFSPFGDDPCDCGYYAVINIVICTEKTKWGCPTKAEYFRHKVYLLEECFNDLNKRFDFPQKEKLEKLPLKEYNAIGHLLDKYK